MEPKCPQCHVAVRETDYYCYNCGKNLKPKPPDTSFAALLPLYLESIVLPPMGIIIGLRYLKNSDKQSKIHGIALVGLTIVELVVLTVWTINFVNGINASVNSQLNGLQGF